MPEPLGNSDDHVAAIDLGSNSFHLIIGREIGGQLSILDRLRDPVRMAAGLDDRGRLSGKVLARILESLERMGERLRDIPPERIRVVGTNAFRSTTKPENLLELASDALGSPIEILAGSEEARLIYLGVSHDQPEAEGRRLVVDIGGGSTECILGEGFAPQILDSFYMGCVSFSMRFFPNGEITKKAFRKAETAAKLEIGTSLESYIKHDWTTVTGSSGTINAIATIQRELGESDGRITLAALKFIRKELIAAGSTENVNVPGLTADRRPVLPGGLAILKAVFESLNIQTMSPCAAALREGLLYDLMGRIRHEDVRDRTIRGLSDRYSIDMDQALRVEETALACFDQVAGDWNLEPESCRQLLSWAARMHEVGLGLSYHGNHRHGAYILDNSTMPGFSRQEQRRLATLVHGYRRKLRLEVFDDAIATWKATLVKLCILLRLAVRLNRSRSVEPVPAFQLRALKDLLEIEFPPGWLAGHPLTRADLEDEDKRLQTAQMGLRIRDA